MKKRIRFPYLIIIMLIFLGSFLIYSHSLVIQKNKIYGQWKSEVNGQEFKVRFSTDGTCILTFKDNDSSLVQILNGDFEISLSKNPIPLSIRNIPNISYPLHSILEFIGDDSIRLAQFSPRWKLRPISFDRNTSINLNRVN